MVQCDFEVQGRFERGLRTEISLEQNMTAEFPHWHPQAGVQTEGREWRFVWWCYLIYLMMVHVLEEPFINSAGCTVYYILSLQASPHQARLRQIGTAPRYLHFQAP